jgi:tetratricopeptide (TPR) repeat protein
MIRPPVLFLAVVAFILFSVSSVFGQSRPPGPDPTMREVTRAMNEGRIVEAEKILVDAIHVLEQDDSRNPRLAIYLGRLAMLYTQRHQFAEALGLLDRAREIDQYAFGFSDTRVVNDLSEIAHVYQEQGDNEKAEKFLAEALATARRSPNQGSYGIEGKVVALSNLASLYISEHRASDAEKLLQEATLLCDATPQLKTPGYGCSMIGGSLAVVYRMEGRPTDPDQVPHSGDELFDQVIGIDNQGQEFQDRGNLEDAKAAYLRAIALIENMPEADASSFLPTEFNHLGQVFEKQGQNQQAEEFYVRAIKTQESSGGPKPPGSFRIRFFAFDFLLNLYRNEDRIKDIEPLIEHVIQTQEQFLGSENPAVSGTLLTLARAYEQQGDLSTKKGDVDGARASYANAKSAVERAIDIQQKNFGPDHPKSIPALGDYASVLRKLQESAAAEKVQARIDAIQGKGRKPDQQEELNNSKSTGPR